MTDRGGESPHTSSIANGMEKVKWEWVSLAASGLYVIDQIGRPITVLSGLALALTVVAIAGIAFGTFGGHKK
ncbi:hypothetical protein FACS1894196_3620 [Clostridia bacterium]|nr:hypothetical protein FACS1894196_3620 [Clostridia bacterium]